MNDHAKQSIDFDIVAKAERFLNSVLGYQAAIAVHQLKDELGLDVEELTLTVAPLESESVGTYRVICSIVRANSPAPLIVEIVVDPDIVPASAHEDATTNGAASRAAAE